MRRILVGVVALAVALLPAAAEAVWGASGPGRGYTAADVAPAGNRPAVSVAGRNVTVSWSASSFTDGSSIADYVVARHDAGSGAPATVGASCAGVVAALSCTENAVAPGSWYYTVIPRHQLWSGTVSPASATAVVASPSLTFSSSATITSLPSTKTGMIASFVTGETVSWRLDDPSAGPVLSGSIAPSPVPSSGSSSISVTIPAGTADGPHTVYAIGSSGTSTASATVTVDTLPPVVSAATIQKAAGGVAGYLRQAGTYYVYASIADPGSAITTATANVSTVTTGSTAVGLTGGSWTVDGVAYNYRSALLTASNPLAAGTKTFSVTATDSFAHTTTATGFTVTVDNTRPSGSSLTTANRIGGTVGLAETGDAITYSFTEPMEPISFLAGWDGTAGTPVTLRLIDAGGGGGDRVQIWNAANTAQLPFGTVRLGSTGYTTTTIAFTNSTMTMAGNAITIVLGTPSGAGSTAVVSSNTRWNPVVTPTDRAGNACTNTAVNEPVPADPEF